MRLLRSSSTPPCQIWRCPASGSSQSTYTVGSRTCGFRRRCNQPPAFCLTATCRYPDFTTAHCSVVYGLLFSGHARGLQTSGMVEKPATRKPHRPVIGAADSKQSVRSVRTKRTVDVFISRLHPSTAKAEVVECVIDALGEEHKVDKTDIKCNKLTSKYEELYSSYHVSVSVPPEHMKDFITLLTSADSWPSGLLVRRHFLTKTGVSVSE